MFLHNVLHNILSLHSICQQKKYLPKSICQKSITMFKIFIFYFIHSFFFFFFYFIFLFYFFALYVQKRSNFYLESSNQKFLREKRESSLKFKARNWDFGREEWNNYRCKFVLLCKLELLTDQWREKKKSNQRIVLQKGRETWRKERGETVKERDLWEEERPELVIVRVWGEKK